MAFANTKKYFEFNDVSSNHPKQVFELSKKVVEQIIAERPDIKVSHLIVATTCPDSLAPSVGQTINEHFYPVFKDSLVIDIVQGCTGGLAALVIGSQFAIANSNSVLVVTVDAAKKACDPQNKLFKNFGNGAFACVIENNGLETHLLHYKCLQYENLVNLVEVKLGHDAEYVLSGGLEWLMHPKKHLGLNMNDKLGKQLILNAKSFYQEFIEEAGITPDVMILHQANPKILGYLERVFKDEDLEFVNVSSLTGNCVAASTGIAFALSAEKIIGKKVFIGSFGTGGVISAGLWQC